MSEEQLATESVDTDLELIEEEVQEEQVSPEVAAFRDELRSRPGEWFVVHSYAGYEKRVKGNLFSASNPCIWRITSMRSRYLKKR